MIIKRRKIMTLARMVRRLKKEALTVQEELLNASVPESQKEQYSTIMGKFENAKKNIEYYERCLAANRFANIQA